MRVLAISGSLRKQSTNTALLRAAAALAPNDVSVALFDEIASLPAFDPDLDAEAGDAIPPQVAAFRQRVGEADGLLVACPEYARGIPGAFKNALDWLVGSREFFEKPVALFNASPRATHAQSALRLVLQTMSARIVEDASIVVPLLGSETGPTMIVDDPKIAPIVAAALRSFKTFHERA